MSWQLVDAPSHIAPEVGANLLVGAGPWTAPLTLDGEYVLTVEVLGGGVVEWSVTGVDGEGLPVTVPGLSETVPDGEWVRVTIPFTAPGLVGDAAVSLTVPGESRDPVLGELTGRTVLTVPGDVLAETIMASGGIIAGTPGGARVELTENGLHAFDAAGVETANIQGEGGEFVGGSFRTSDALPGQVEIRDDGYVDGDGLAYPGIRVTPSFEHNTARPPGIGPNENGLIITGGTDTAGQRAYISATPTNANIQSTRADGTRFILGSQNNEVSMRRVNSDGVESAAIWATDTSIGMVRGVSGDGANFGVIVNASGVWVARYGQGGASYNLLETAQDSGWQSITPDAGYTGSTSFAWRNKGGVIWYRGTVTATWSAGWNTIATLPAEVRPEYGYTVNEAGTAAGVLIRVQVDGRLELYAPAAGTSTHRLTSLSYPIG